MEELFKFTLMARDRSGYLVSRYSERKGAVQTKALAAAAAVVEAPVVGVVVSTNGAPEQAVACGGSAGCCA